MNHVKTSKMTSDPADMTSRRTAAFLPSFPTAIPKTMQKNSTPTKLDARVQSDQSKPNMSD